MRRSSSLFLLVLLAFPLAIAAQDEPEEPEERPAHPGGRIDIDRVVGGALDADAIRTVLDTVPPLLERCAIARARRETADDSSHAFDLTISPEGRGTPDRLALDPASHPPAHEVRWLSCARGVIQRLRFPTAEDSTDARLRLVWMRNDLPEPAEP